MIQRFATGIFTRDYKKTIGVDFLEKGLLGFDYHLIFRFFKSTGFLPTTLKIFGTQIHVLINKASHFRSRLFRVSTVLSDRVFFLVISTIMMISGHPLWHSLISFSSSLIINFWFVKLKQKCRFSTRVHIYTLKTNAQ